MKRFAGCEFELLAYFVFLGRDGRVKEIHAGFAGPANPPAHEALVHEVTELVEQLLAEPVPSQSASR